MPLLYSVRVRCGGEDVEVSVEYQGLPPRCDQCNTFGHEALKCKEYKRDRDSVISQEVGIEGFYEQESQSDSSSSSEWIKVGKRRKTNKKKRQDKTRRSSVAQPGSPPCFPVIQHRGPSIDRPSRLRLALPCDPDSQPCSAQVLTPASSARCPVPHPSSATRAAMLCQAVEGSG
ncbi:hypothetical protein U1Q18_052796 [Sarracenia purpurea var. burkii]